MSATLCVSGQYTLPLNNQVNIQVNKLKEHLNSFLHLKDISTFPWGMGTATCRLHSPNYFSY